MQNVNSTEPVNCGLLDGGEILLLGLNGGSPIQVFELDSFREGIQVCQVSAPARRSTCTLKYAE